MGHKINRILIWVNEDYSDMQGPAPDGFHVPLNTEWQAIYDAYTGLGLSGGINFATYLKMPMAGCRSQYARTADVNSKGYYWSSSPNAGGREYYEYYLSFLSDSIAPQEYGYASTGYSIRCIKDTPITPTSSWTKLYGTSIESGGIFHNAIGGLISISSNGSTWYTIMDKNLGATTVYNYGDTLTEDNCGNVFQRGNNYAFPGTLNSVEITTSADQINTTGYGPGNYYEGSTWIRATPWQLSFNNYGNNLRGGVSQGGGTILVEKQLYSGTPPVQPVNETFSYTGSDQTWTVPYTQEYIITAKGAGSNTSAGGLGQGTILLNAGDKLSIMVGQSGSSTSSTTYGFGGSSNYSSNRAGGGLSGVFTGDSAITATSSVRALVIGGGAGAGGRGAGGAGGGETGADGVNSGYGTAGGGGTQSGRNSGGSVGANQFNGGNGGGTYGYGGGGGWFGGNASIGDSSADDDKGAGGGSGYVISTASDRTLTQGGGAAAGNNGEVTIVSVLQ